MKYIKFIFLVLGLIPTQFLWADSTIDVQLYNRSDNTITAEFTFSGLRDATTDNPWVITDQYIRMTYSSDETWWMLRIVTDNKSLFPLMHGKPIKKGANDRWDGSPETNPLSDDIVSYGGLVNGPTQRNPENRATLAWQVFRYNDPYNTDGMLVNPPISENPVDTDVEGEPGEEDNGITNWGYLCDKSDTGYVVDPLNEYFWVAYGSGDFSLLGQHPVVYRDRDDILPKPGGGEAIIYIAACLGKNQSGNPSEKLSAGDYYSRIYLEIVHE